MEFSLLDIIGPDLFHTLIRKFIFDFLLNVTKPFTEGKVQQKDSYLNFKDYTYDYFYNIPKK